MDRPAKEQTSDCAAKESQRISDLTKYVTLEERDPLNLMILTSDERGLSIGLRKQYSQVVHLCA